MPSKKRKLNKTSEPPGSGTVIKKQTPKGPGEGMQDIQATSDPVGEAVQTDDVGEAAPVMCTTGTRTSGQTAVSLQGDNFSASLLKIQYIIRDIRNTSLANRSGAAAPTSAERPRGKAALRSTKRKGDDAVMGHRALLEPQTRNRSTTPTSSSSTFNDTPFKITHPKKRKIDDTATDDSALAGVSVSKRARRKASAPSPSAATHTAMSMAGVAPVKLSKRETRTSSSSQKPSTPSPSAATHPAMSTAGVAPVKLSKRETRSTSSSSQKLSNPSSPAVTPTAVSMAEVAPVLSKRQTRSMSSSSQKQSNPSSSAVTPTTMSMAEVAPVSSKRKTSTSSSSQKPSASSSSAAMTAGVTPVLSQGETRSMSSSSPYHSPSSSVISPAELGLAPPLNASGSKIVSPANSGSVDGPSSSSLKTSHRINNVAARLADIDEEERVSLIVSAIEETLDDIDQQAFWEKHAGAMIEVDDIPPETIRYLFKTLPRKKKVEKGLKEKEAVKEAVEREASRGL